MKSNICGWRKLHVKGRYYDVHPNYANKNDRHDHDLEFIGGFLLRREWAVAIIGSGYGRETARIAPFVRVVYAIDVGDMVFNQMKSYLEPRHIFNVLPINAEFWRKEIAEYSIDFIYSIVTFQHLTRDLARDYIEGFFPRLRAGGMALIQFSESPTGTFDTEDVAIEPNVRWTRPEIEKLIEGAGYKIHDLRSISGVGGTRAKKPWTWHWAFFGKDAGGGK